MDGIDYLLKIPTKEIKYGLERTERLLKICGSPEKHIKSVQIIGTNGKGSVSAFLTNILDASNYKVGWYTSPHLIDLNERIRINFQNIPNKTIRLFIKLYKKDIERLNTSFFEIMTVMAMWHFQREAIDIAILETGLGGRFDSVTACKNKYLIFTKISMDHKEILGNTIDKIANEKAGAIINKKQKCFSIKQNKNVEKIINKKAEIFNIKIYYIDTKNTPLYSTTKPEFLIGDHQKENAILAKYFIETFKKNCKKQITNTRTNKAIIKTIWPGRFQIISNKPQIIYDVCHNEDGINMFKQTLQNHYDNKINKYLICGFEENKKIRKSISSIENMFDQIVCTETGIRKSMSTKKLRTFFKNKNKIRITKNANKAIQQTIKKAKKNEVIFIIGSHFFAPHINKLYKNCFAIHY